MGKLSSQQLHACRQHVSNVHPNLLAMERRPPTDFLSTIQKGNITASDRTSLVDFMMHMAQHLHLSHETRHLAVSLADRFLSAKPGVEDLGLLGTASLRLAARYQEKIDSCPSLAAFLDTASSVSNCCYTRGEALAMESDILTTISHVVQDGPTAISFLRGFATVVDGEHQLLWKAAKYIAQRSLRDYVCGLLFVPSEVAAASVFLASCRYGLPWTPAMSKAIGYSPSYLKDCIFRLYAESLPLLEKDNRIDIFAAVVNEDQTCSEPNLAALSLN